MIILIFVSLIFAFFILQTLHFTRLKPEDENEIRSTAQPKDDDHHTDKEVDRDTSAEFSLFESGDEAEPYIFCLSKNRRVQNAFRRLWIVPTLMFLVSILTTLIIVYSSFRNTYFFRVSTLTLVGPVLLVVIVQAFTYQSFISKAPQKFAALARLGRIKFNKERDEEGLANGLLKSMKWIIMPRPDPKEKYGDEIDAALKNWRGKVLIGFFIILAATITILAIPLGDLLPYLNWRALFWPSLAAVIWFITVYGFFIIFVGYFTGVVLWTFLVVSLHIFWLSPDYFELDIHPEHPDGSGGLRRLGDICLNMALITLVTGILLGFWIKTGALNYTTPIGGTGIPALIFVGYLIVIFYIIVPFFLFFGPLWDIHHEMVLKNTEKQDEITSKLAEVKSALKKKQDRIWKNYNEEETGQPDINFDEKEVETEIKALNDLKKFYEGELALKYPNWPYNFAIFAKFSAAQILAIIVWVFPISDDLAEFLREVVG